VRAAGTAGRGRSDAVERFRAVLLAAALMLSASVHGADAVAGRTKAQACVACHGADGNSSQPLIPSLAGQPPLYIYYQLVQFREGLRVNDLMGPFAAHLTDADMKDIAAYFSEQKPQGAGPPPDPARSEAGKAVVARNHCGSCHTPTLTGQNHIPRIAGLSYPYLVRQLRGFKTGDRSDIDGAMTSAAQPLSDQDITDVSAYLASLR
jgi:cytochrome c553